ncbi:MAG TPA: hypothetical protein VLM79_21255, partial [Kofleriaceae bacterium]|nr:hypothetical protein [Kofleriaceae bacterium]
MTNDTEPRALGAALAAPAFVTRGHGVAMHAANRHVERWAPETTAKRVRSMHTLGFVDRLVAPWVETAQRSASLRLFSQYARNGASEREPSQVSWVFPRPWYQDELDWMAAARQVRAQSSSSSGDSQPAQAMPTLLTTRGTFVPPAQEAPTAAPPVAMPSALYEFVAPSLSLAAGRPAAIPGVGFGGETIARHDAYSPLIPLAAVHAADLMSRTVAPLAVQRAGAAPTAITPQLRSVLTSILERAASARMPAGELPTTRLAMSAPELVTPPAPRPADIGRGAVAAQGAEALETAPRETVAGADSATQVAERYAEQRARIFELQRLAQASAQREAAARAEVAARAQAEAAARTSSESAAAGRAPAGDAAASAAAAQARAAAQAAAMADARAVAQTAASTEARTAAQSAATAEAQVAQAEMRAAAERAEAELRQRAAGPRATEAQRHAEAQGQADLQRQAEAAREAEAERARVEARIAQRVSERTGAQRLHEQARAEAAAHARTPLDVRLPESRGAAPAPRAELPAEVTAAIAGLPPELAALLGPTATARPEQTMQAIGQLNETLRTVELLARSSAAGVPFEAIRGPRLVMPAGLGGLINAVDRAQSIAARPAALAGERMLAPLPQLMAGQPPMFEQRPVAARAEREVRVPALSWLSAAPAPSATEPATALAATANAAPAALSHVAWADRWLARFSGAAPQSLQAITAAGTDAPAMRMAALASAAPGSVFVVPDFARGDQGAHEAARFEAMARAAALADAPVGTAAAAAAAAAAQSMVPGPRLINPMPSEALRRFDDTAETPDDVFAAISAAAARSRGTAAQAATPRIVVSATPGTEPATARQTYADLVAQSAPAAPGPGLSAQLASSPFAPGLRHVVPMPSAASFDVRSLFGAGLGATYLAGLIAPTSQSLEIGVQRSPTWASWAEAPLAQLGADQIDRLVPAFEPAYVSPTAPSFDDQAAFGEPGTPGAETAAWPSAAAAQTAAAQAAAAQAAVSAIAAGAPQPAAATADQTAASVPLTTVRSALLSWEVAANEQGAPQLVPASFLSLPYAGAPATPAVGAPTGQAASMLAYREMLAQLGGAARTMLEAMSLPMLGEGPLDQPAAWAAPGMLANRAQSWSVAQERSTSDLALDFVAPELVAAARVYGLGPAEAAQAARLAVVGQSQLGAMASTVDRTFVEAMTIGREARTLEAERQQRLAAGFSIGDTAGLAPGVAAPAAMAPEVAAQAAARAVAEG